MSIIKCLEEKVRNVFIDSGYNVECVNLVKSSRPDLGDFQINNCMALAKSVGKNPRDIASSVADKLSVMDEFTNINIAGPGFINITLTDKFLISSANLINSDIYNNIDKLDNGKIIIDYGGANIAKALHVGHLRSANIGEALKRLAKSLGKDVTADVHFGDIGRQSGMVIYELRERYPNLNYFDGLHHDKYDDLPITEKDLESIYPTASTKAKENDEIMETVRTITAELEKGREGYVELWNRVKELSKSDIRKLYKRLNTNFDLWEGESDCYPYIPEMIDYLKDNNYLTSSEGALVIDVHNDDDVSPMPPLVVVKSNGATLYATRELATIYSRMKRFNPDEIWYITDNRQDLYFNQVFRASYKSKIVDNNTKLSFYPFGTMNGMDGKPFKTRDGGVMNLTDLVEMVKAETTKKLKDNISVEERDGVAESVAIAAVKYADFLPFRTTDYIFDINKFSDLEGKTGPYLLYSTIRMKSLISKAKLQGITYDNVEKLKGETDRNIIIELLSLPNVLRNAYDTKSLNEIAEYLYRITNIYNKFYAEERVLSCFDYEQQSSWICLTETVMNVNMFLLDILAIKVPEKM